MNNTTKKPTIQVLTYKENQSSALLDIFMLLANYFVAFPIFILCWYAVIMFLKRRGHITNREAQTMMEEIKTIPKNPNLILAGQSNRRFI